MARKKRSYLSASNKGKAGQVFVNNLLVGAEKKRKERKHKEQQNAKAKAAIVRKIAIEKEKAEKERVKQQKQYQKVTEQKLKQREAAKAKYEKYFARARIECQKLNLDSVCYDLVAKEAIEAGVTVAQIGNVVLKDREQYWQEKIKEIKEDQYKISARKACAEIREQKGILERFEENLIADIIDSRIEINKIKDSSLIDKYSHESCQILSDIESRLEAHVERSIYE